MNRKVIIVGSGPAGLSAAIYAARAGLSPLLLEGLNFGGQLAMTTEVENYPGFADGISGPELMEAMKGQALRFGVEFLRAQLSSISADSRPLLLDVEGTDYRADAVILATGASPRFLGLEGEKELLGYGLSTCATCDGPFHSGAEVVVVGGGDSACEEALFLANIASKVYLIHRRDALRASSIMAERVIANGNIEILWNSVLVELVGDPKSGLQSCVIEDLSSAKTRRLEPSAVFYAIGHDPNSGIFRDLLKLDSDGYVLTEPHSTKTGIEGVFACGDLRDKVFRQAITSAASGDMAAIECERFLRELR